MNLYKEVEGRGENFLQSGKKYTNIINQVVLLTSLALSGGGAYAGENSSAGKTWPLYEGPVLTEDLFWGARFCFTIREVQENFLGDCKILLDNVSSAPIGGVPKLCLPVGTQVKPDWTVINEKTIKHYTISECHE